MLTADLIELAGRYGRYGYRKIGALLKAAGWLVNDKRIERIWRREGLKVPAKQPKRGRLWNGDGSCLRLRPKHRNPRLAWSMEGAIDHAACRDRAIGDLIEHRQSPLLPDMAGPAAFNDDAGTTHGDVLALLAGRSPVRSVAR